MVPAGPESMYRACAKALYMHAVREPTLAGSSPAYSMLIYYIWSRGVIGSHARFRI